MELTHEHKQALEGLIDIYQSNIDSVRTVLKGESFAFESLGFILKDNTELIGYQNDHILWSYRVLKELYDKVNGYND